MQNWNKSSSMHWISLRWYTNSKLPLIDNAMKILIEFRTPIPIHWNSIWKKMQPQLSVHCLQIPFTNHYIFGKKEKLVFITVSTEFGQFILYYEQMKTFFRSACSFSFLWPPNFALVYHKQTSFAFICGTHLSNNFRTMRT